MSAKDKINERKLPSHHPLLGMFHHGPSRVERPIVYPMVFTHTRDNAHMPMLGHSPPLPPKTLNLTPCHIWDSPVLQAASHLNSTQHIRQKSIQKPIQKSKSGDLSEWIFINKEVNTFTLKK